MFTNTSVLPYPYATHVTTGYSFTAKNINRISVKLAMSLVLKTIKSEQSNFSQ